MSDVESKIEALESRVEALEASSPRPEDLQVGDTVRVVITDPNTGGDRDPFTRIDGLATFVKFPDGYAPSFGETVRVAIADISETTIVAVAQEDGLDD